MSINILRNIMSHFHKGINRTRDAKSLDSNMSVEYDSTGKIHSEESNIYTDKFSSNGRPKRSANFKSFTNKKIKLKIANSVTSNTEVDLTLSTAKELKIEGIVTNSPNKQYMKDSDVIDIENHIPSSKVNKQAHVKDLGTLKNRTNSFEMISLSQTSIDNISISPSFDEKAVALVKAVDEFDEVLEKYNSNGVSSVKTISTDEPDKLFNDFNEMASVKKCYDKPDDKYDYETVITELKTESVRDSSILRLNSKVSVMEFDENNVVEELKPNAFNTNTRTDIDNLAESRARFLLTIKDILQPEFTCDPTEIMDENITDVTSAVSDISCQETTKTQEIDDSLNKENKRCLTPEKLVTLTTNIINNVCSNTEQRDHEMDQDSLFKVINVANNILSNTLVANITDSITNTQFVTYRDTAKETEIIDFDMDCDTVTSNFDNNKETIQNYSDLNENVLQNEAKTALKKSETSNVNYLTNIMVGTTSNKMINENLNAKGEHQEPDTKPLGENMLIFTKKNILNIVNSEILNETLNSDDDLNINSAEEERSNLTHSRKQNAFHVEDNIPTENHGTNAKDIIDLTGIERFNIYPKDMAQSSGIPVSLNGVSKAIVSQDDFKESNKKTRINELNNNIHKKKDCVDIIFANNSKLYTFQTINAEKGDIKKISPMINTTVNNVELQFKDTNNNFNDTDFGGKNTDNKDNFDPQMEEFQCNKEVALSKSERFCDAVKKEAINSKENKSASQGNVFKTQTIINTISNRTGQGDTNYNIGNTAQDKGVDTISISSDECENGDGDAISISSESDDSASIASGSPSYHSSDFEFITEEESKLDDLIINAINKNVPKDVDDIEITLYKLHTSDTRASNRNRIVDNQCLTYRRYLQYKNPFKHDTSYRVNYRVPENEEYLNLFRGHLSPAQLSNVIFMENKTLRDRTKMMVQNDGIGFERQIYGKRRASSDSEFKDEAEETATMIRSMYPGENSKKRRRY